MREFRRLVVEFASAFVAEELDARRRADPRFTERATPADWRALLRSARQEQTATVRWPAAPPPAALPDADEAARWQAEAGRLSGEVARLTAEVSRLSDELALARLFRPAVPASGVQDAAPQERVTQEPGPQDQAPEPPAPAALIPAPVKPVAAPKAAPAVTLLGLADVRLPDVPAVAPARFAGQFQAWPREGLALAILSVTGWSMRLAVAERLSAVLGSVKANAGSLRRTYGTLAKRGYWIEHKVTLPGVHTPAPDADDDEADAALPAGPAGDTTLVLVQLGNPGRDLLRACGIQPGPCEWEQLAAAHGSQIGARYAGPVCAFTYHARLRGYATALAPADGATAGARRGQAGPSVLVRQDGETLLVAVVGNADPGAFLLAMAGQQERVAFVTLTPALRDRLVAQAQAAGAEHGLATDLQTLFNTQAARGPLWAVQW